MAAMTDPVVRLRQLMERAEPGPWRLDQYEDDFVDTGLRTIKAGCSANAALIIAMHEALPALLDIAEAAQDLLDRSPEGLKTGDRIVHDLRQALSRLK